MKIEREKIKIEIINTCMSLMRLFKFNMRLYRGTVSQVIKREVEKLNKEYLSYNCDPDYHPAVFAFECACKMCGRKTEFAILSRPLKDKRKCYEIHIYMFPHCSKKSDTINDEDIKTGSPCMDVSIREKHIDLDDLHTTIDIIGEKFDLIRMKMREPYYTKGRFVTLGDSYYW